MVPIYRTDKNRVSCTERWISGISRNCQSSGSRLATSRVRSCLPGSMQVRGLGSRPGHIRKIYSLCIGGKGVQSTRGMFPLCQTDTRLAELRRQSCSIFSSEAEFLPGLTDCCVTGPLIHLWPVTSSPLRTWVAYIAPRER